MNAAQVVTIVVSVLGGGTLAKILDRWLDARQGRRLTSGEVDTTEAKDLWTLLRQAYVDAIARVEKLETTTADIAEREAKNRALLAACEAAGIEKDRQIIELRKLVARLMGGAEPGGA